MWNFCFCCRLVFCVRRLFSVLDFGFLNLLWLFLFWGCLSFWDWLHVWGPLPFWGCLFFVVLFIFKVCLHFWDLHSFFWSPLHFRFKFILEVSYFARLSFINSTTSFITHSKSVVTSQHNKKSVTDSLNHPPTPHLKHLIRYNIH